MSAIVVFDIDGVIRDVTNSYRRALADTVEHFTGGNHRPNMEEIDNLKGEGVWNNDWEGSQELIYRYYEGVGTPRSQVNYSYGEIVHFFQCRYRGRDPQNADTWDGYITQEPLLVDGDFFQGLTDNGYFWGFFSGATRGSAEYILTRRLGLKNPVLVAMEDAPGKPDPTGLFMAVESIKQRNNIRESLPVLYLGDTVADMMTITRAKSVKPDDDFRAIAVLPPHIHHHESLIAGYSKKMLDAGAQEVLTRVIDFSGC
ncbi:TIGR01548 family HAD-type hydrolase [Cyanobacterium stanieri LEGE 03274]|uniref:TIGR01548 family HAD-type hydrolase n=1 Tax=Cyanobacterium stanieri LEGE 03274 TaxID=1828756 RepID=A0ABR9V297_9CHRO|nr:TIGR01548 family HAD-type hydrolase [Cyanobacterium stanieri]MBE9222002.1 TIGR01548 family HAD-type hydrolase [Cyanobacterium stanieri LEGE 03274]